MNERALRPPYDVGHSVAMQKGTYDRRTQQQKVAPAIGLMSAINARAAAAEPAAASTRER